MSQSTRQIGPVLRLVGEYEPRGMPTPREAAEARRDVARENRLASTLSPHDARWRLAVDVAGAIEGGRAGLLSPERRRRLLARAADLGLRPFDANLVLAVVQDAAMEGRALSPETQARLMLVRPADPDLLASHGRKFVASLILAAGIMLTVVVWVWWIG
jgi:hypothetical protein